MPRSFKSRPAGPWYANFDYWKAHANRYLQALDALPADAPHHAEIENFSALAAWRLIFESNLIEGEGLSRGQTREVVLEHFPRIPINYEVFREFRQRNKIGNYIFDKMLDAFGQWNRLGGESLTPSVLFGAKTKEWATVTSHHFAYLQGRAVAIRFIPQRVRYEAARHLVATIENKPERLKAWRRIFPDEKVLPHLVRPPRLFTGHRIRKMHAKIASQFMPSDARELPGEYRTGPVSVGPDLILPAAETVPDCMQKWERDSNRLISDVLDSRAGIFMACARVSYDFVRIHPFPDFNGRISRLILMMALQATGLPFPLTLRGDRKGRKRYFRSLRLANAGDLKPYAALIAMRLAETFEELDANLKLAGYPALLTYA